MSDVNLFSDTQTRPTDAMRRAMASAEVGDEQLFADPTTLRLQNRVANLLGHDAAVLLPSGTMCNLIAFRLHIRPGGDEVILDAGSHPVIAEAGSPAAFAGAMVEKIHTEAGIFTAEQVEALIHASGDRYHPRSRLVSIEQTTNMGGGRVWPLEGIRSIIEVAHRHEMRTHLDGARLMNAVIASHTSAAEFASGFDTAWVDFSKGLGAPVGAVLCGGRELIAEAWRYKQMLGGALRQSGILAAACLHALDHHVERLATDHENARVLAEGIAEIKGVQLDPSTVETNIVIFEVEDALALVGRLWDNGVRMGPVGGRRVRAVTHLDVDRPGIERAIREVRTALGG